MKTSVMRALMILGPTGAYDLDHNTTPEVVKISKESNMIVSCGGRLKKVKEAAENGRGERVAANGLCARFRDLNRLTANQAHKNSKYPPIQLPFVPSPPLLLLIAVRSCL
jgi:hypothetical protein